MSLRVGYSPPQLLFPNQSLEDGDKLREARFPDYTDDALVLYQQCKNVIASRRGLAISIEDHRV